MSISNWCGQVLIPSEHIFQICSGMARYQTLHDISTKIYPGMARMKTLTDIYVQICTGLAMYISFQICPVMHSY